MRGSVCCGCIHVYVSGCGGGMCASRVHLLQWSRVKELKRSIFTRCHSHRARIINRQTHSRSACKPTLLTVSTLLTGVGFVRNKLQQHSLPTCEGQWHSFKRVEERIIRIWVDVHTNVSTSFYIHPSVHIVVHLWQLSVITIKMVETHNFKGCFLHCL